MEADAALDTLVTLVETCRDAERGFRVAADAVDDPGLRRLFTAYARQRARFAEELEHELLRLGGARGARAPGGGGFHRALLGLRTALGRRDAQAILEEAERAETRVGATYARAVQRGLPADVRAVVARQAALIQDAHDRLSDLAA